MLLFNIVNSTTEHEKRERFGVLVLKRQLYLTIAVYSFEY